jgi:hypothetical protein
MDKILYGMRLIGCFGVMVYESRLISFQQCPALKHCEGQALKTVVQKNKFKPPMPGCLQAAPDRLPNPKAIPGSRVCNRRETGQVADCYIKTTAPHIAALASLGGFPISRPGDSTASNLLAGTIRHGGSVPRQTIPRRRPILDAESGPCPNARPTDCRCRTSRRPGRA